MKNKKSEYQGISKRAQALLEKSEDYDVEFKESLAGLESEDLVAFANSDEGGSILIGVKEIKKGGRQRGEIVGCSIGDKNKQAIINKAVNCSPPITIEIFIENLSMNPFFRIEILDCRDKPYSTMSGTYKIRGDGQNLALIPGLLLRMFMDRETQIFIERYKDATRDFEIRMSSLLEDIGKKSSKLGGKLSEVTDISIDVAMKSDEIVSNTEGFFHAIADLESKLHDVDLDEELIGLKSRVDSVILKLGIEPLSSQILQDAKEIVSNHAATMVMHQHEKDAEIIEYLKQRYPWLDAEKLDEWIKEGQLKFEEIKKEVAQGKKKKKRNK